MAAVNECLQAMKSHGNINFLQNILCKTLQKAMKTYGGIQGPLQSFERLVSDDAKKILASKFFRGTKFFAYYVFIEQLVKFGLLKLL